MADEIETRLKESADECLKSYGKWSGDKKNASARQDLQTAVHELRKVASRLEIELAVSDRNDGGQKQIPIPPHRDARGRHQNADDNEGADGNNDGQSKGAKGGQGRGRRRSSSSTPKKAAGGEG